MQPDVDDYVLGGDIIEGCVTYARANEQVWEDETIGGDGMDCVQSALRDEVTSTRLRHICVPLEA